jgi:PAS domain-containing protein
METALIVLVFIASLAAATDIVLVRRRAAAESEVLHVALKVAADHLSALGSVSDAWSILESAPGYMVVRDSQARITYITAAAANLMNSTPPRLLGSTSITVLTNISTYTPRW